MHQTLYSTTIRGSAQLAKIQLEFKNYSGLGGALACHQYGGLFILLLTAVSKLRVWDYYQVNTSNKSNICVWSCYYNSPWGELRALFYPQNTLLLINNMNMKKFAWRTLRKISWNHFSLSRNIFFKVSTQTVRRLLRDIIDLENFLLFSSQI